MTAIDAEAIDQSLISRLVDLFAQTGGLPYPSDLEAAGFANCDYLKQRDWITPAAAGNFFMPAGAVREAYLERIA